MTPAPTTLRAPSIEETRGLMEVALGRRPADLAVVNATLLNVYTRELLKGTGIAVRGRWIAYVGTEPGHTIGAATRVLDAGGMTVIPGLIDGHTHLASLCAPSEFLRYAMRGGTTTLITESMEPYPVAGRDGVLDFLEALGEQPVKILATAPAMASISRSTRGVPLAELIPLLQRDDVVGLGESYWQEVLREPDLYLPAGDAARQARKTLEGHSAGAGGGKLAAYAATGIDSCHEPIRAQEALERLRLGIRVMAREGAVRRDLQQIATLKDAGVDLRRLILVSDGAAPAELLEQGYMESVVRKAVQYGLDPITAIQAVTLNPAEHFHLSHLIGGIAPGRCADLVIVPDLRNPKAEWVVSNGRVIARQGELQVEPRRHLFPARCRRSVHLPRPVSAADFRIPAAGRGARVRVRAIEMVTDLVTREIHLEVPAAGGEIPGDAGLELIKAAAIDRRAGRDALFVGLIKGFGLAAGAMACSAAWDAADIIVVGASEQDMALAVNRVAELQGGIALCQGGRILQEIPLPVFGLLFEGPLEELVRRQKALKSDAARLGIPFPDPLLSLITLTTAAIPYLRICEEGYVNLKDGKTVGVFVDG